MTETTKEIGFVGLGHMGRHMARRLLEAGYSLTVFDVRPEAMDELVKQGAKSATSPSNVADQCDTVLVSLPTPQVVLEVAAGHNGIVEGRAVKTYVDLSTTGRQVAQEVQKALSQKGIQVVDAPVSGGPPGAEKGTLAVMVACADDVFDEVSSLLKVIGKNVFHVGREPGQGQVVKLANNMLSAAAVVATSEAMVMTAKAGLDPATVLDIFNASSGRNSATQDKFPKDVITRRFNYGFQVGLMNKDLKLCMEEAESLGVPMWLGTEVKQFFSFAMTQGRADDDITSLVKWVEQWGGVEVGEA